MAKPRTLRSISRSAFIGCLLLAGACSTASIPASDASAQRFIGPWRIALLGQTGTFSDYVFSKDGTLTLLRAVADGQGVEPSASAGVVRAAGAAASCVFGSSWHSEDLMTLVIDGDCNDAQPRDIELTFADDKQHVSEQVTVSGVGGDSSWMQPVAWKFDKCDRHPCK